MHVFPFGSIFHCFVRSQLLTFGEWLGKDVNKTPKKLLQTVFFLLIKVDTNEKTFMSHFMDGHYMDHLIKLMSNGLPVVMK